MLEYVKGDISELSPTFVVIDNQGLGYFINISLTTYAALEKLTSCQLYLYEAIREDAFVLYGFLKKEERNAFLQLISVSGVGANTARMILSSLSVSELQEAVISGNENALKNVKGIGLKTAQRIIVDLKDKLGNLDNVAKNSLSFSRNQGTRSEAVSALVMLGFNAAVSQKAVDRILAEMPDIRIEELVKKSLKMV